MARSVEISDDELKRNIECARREAHAERTLWSPIYRIVRVDPLDDYLRTKPGTEAAIIKLATVRARHARILTIGDARPTFYDPQDEDESDGDE